MIKHALVLILTIGWTIGIAVADPELDLTVEVDFGKDLGQNFGSLFEGRDETGQLVFGAGFSAVYNSYYRGERNKLQFFIRPDKNEDSYKIEEFPRPSKIPNTYVYDLGADLYVQYKTQSDGLLKYDSNDKQWNEALGEDSHGVFASIVRGKRLEMLNDDVVYDGKVIFDPPDHPIYRYYYYGQGHLFFYRQTNTEEGEIQKAVIAIPWTPYDEPIVADISKEIVLDIFFPPEFPYAYGQLRDEVLTCSNWGGLYAFDGEGWKILRKPMEGVSYQIYTMITYGDRLLMGQYPTGFFIEYDGKEVKVLENWPPVPNGASPSARELQTAAIYRGELFAGVWPWAELWRMNPDSEGWVQMGRLFDQPEVHAKPVHPFEEEAKAAGLVLNQLGHRLTSMVPTDNGLLMGTSWKGGETLIDPAKVTMLSQEQIDEYGEPHLLGMPGNVEVTLPWKDSPTELRFTLEEGKMKISRDGQEITSCPFECDPIGDLSTAKIEWGKGIFGPINGEIIKHDP